MRKIPAHEVVRRAFLEYSTVLGECDSCCPYSHVDAKLGKSMFSIMSDGTLRYIKVTKGTYAMLHGKLEVASRFIWSYARTAVDDRQLCHRESISMGSAIRCIACQDLRDVWMLGSIFCRSEECGRADGERPSPLPPSCTAYCCLGNVSQRPRQTSCPEAATKGHTQLVRRGECPGFGTS